MGDVIQQQLAKTSMCVDSMDGYCRISWCIWRISPRFWGVSLRLSEHVIGFTMLPAGTLGFMLLLCSYGNKKICAFGVQ